MGGNIASEMGVEDSEGVLKVEIALESEVSLVGLKFALKVDGVAKSVDKAVLLMDSEDGALGGGQPHGVSVAMVESSAVDGVAVTVGARVSAAAVVPAVSAVD